MENEKRNFFEETKELAANYIEDNLLLMKLEAAEKAAKTTSSLVKIVVIVVLSFFIIAIATFLAGYYLSIATNSFAIGFGSVALLYVLLIVVFNHFHKTLLGKRVADKVVEAFFK